MKSMDDMTEADWDREIDIAKKSTEWFITLLGAVKEWREARQAYLDSGLDLDVVGARDCSQARILWDKYNAAELRLAEAAAKDDT